MKNPNTAFGLNFLLPGAGHMYLGMWAEGAARFLLDVVLVFLAIAFEIPDNFLYLMMIAVNAWHGIDAYRKAKREKEDEEYHPHSLTYHVQRSMPTPISGESFLSPTNTLPLQPSPNVMGFQSVRESVVFRVSDLRVNNEVGYDGYVTDRRIVLMRGDKVMDMANTLISSISVEEDKKVRYKYTILIMAYSCFLFLLMLLSLSLPESFGWLFVFFTIAGEVWIFAKFFTAEKEYVSISGAGKQYKIKAKKKVLERFMVEAKQQALRSVQYSSSLTTDQLPLHTQLLPPELRQPPQTGHAKAVIKEEQMAKTMCPFCRNPIDSKIDICPHCKAMVKRFFEDLI